MSTLSVIKNNFFDLLEGKTDFNGMLAGDGAAIEANIKSAAAPIQPILETVYSSFKAGASAAVGVGETALGGIMAQSGDTFATAMLNMMQTAGIPTNGVLSVAEHAALVQLFNGVHTMLERMHLLYSAPAVQATPTTEPDKPS